MLFCHLIDDFVLQDKFCYLKQKSWWIKTCKDEGLSMEKYGNDYKSVEIDIFKNGTVYQEGALAMPGS